MSETTQRDDDAERETSDAPAEGAVDPGQDTTATTAHSQDPAEGVDRDEPGQH